MIEGRIWKYGDDVNTDVIFPGKYTYTITDPSEMARHALEDLDPSFATNVNKNDVIIAGSNFGCGSSREQAPISIKEAGVAAIIAKSFARIFFRNAINSGLLVITCPDIYQDVEMSDPIRIDKDKNIIYANNKSYTYPNFSREVEMVLEYGGLAEYTKAIITKNK